MTYADLADYLGVTKGAVSNYINGHREPSIKTAKGIAKALNISISELLGDES